MTELTEVQKIRKLNDWPRWPWLPVKRWGKDTLQIGVIYADDIDGPVRVWNVNIFQCTMQAAVALTNDVPCPWPIHKTYTDIEAMVDDGWKGD